MVGCACLFPTVHFVGSDLPCQDVFQGWFSFYGSVIHRKTNLRETRGKSDHFILAACVSLSLQESVELKANDGVSMRSRCMRLQ